MRQGVTPIDQLINLDEEDKTRDETLNKFKTRSIRNTGGRGGMTSYEKIYNTPIPPVQPQEMHKTKYEPEVEDYRGSPPSLSPSGESAYFSQRQDDIYESPYGGGQLRVRSRDRLIEPYDEDSRYNGGSCIDLAHHSTNCPVCSRLYNTDKTPYMVLIGLLVIICLILLKKVLEK